MVYSTELVTQLQPTVKSKPKYMSFHSYVYTGNLYLFKTPPNKFLVCSRDIRSVGKLQTLMSIQQTCSTVLQYTSYETNSMTKERQNVSDTRKSDNN